MVSGSLKGELSLYVMAACLEVSSVWTEALQGRGDVCEALARVSALTQADLCGLARCKSTMGKPEGYGSFSRRTNAKPGMKSPECISFGYFGSNLFLGVETSIWTKSDARNDNSRVQVVPLVDGNGYPLQDIYSVILERTADGITVLELQFREVPSLATATAIKLMSDSFSKSWKRRLPGIAVTSGVRAVNNMGREAEEETFVPILSYQNPKGLSRAEFRVCVMVHSGLQVAKIAEALHISAKTVRGHLSSIYSKVGVSGQFELLHLLTSEHLGEDQNLRIG